MAMMPEAWDGKQRLPVVIVCPHCHQVGAVQLPPGFRGDLPCPRCTRQGAQLDPDSWLARQIVALAMDALGITHERKREAHDANLRRHGVEYK